MNLVRKPFRIIRANLRVYLLLNALAYGTFVIGFIVGLLFPDLVAGRAQAMEDDGTAALITSLLSSPWLFALTILAVNTLRLGALTILLPSLVVPFLGLATFAIWSVTTGVTLVPATPEGWVALIPHSLTLVIELQAYILLLLGAFLLGKYWLRPQTIQATTRRRGYVRGLQHIGWLSLPALALLVIGAVYEAFSLLYFVYPLQQWLLG
ncbi:hypothetical protein LJR044_003515 [Microbacterium foliorum]